MKLFVAAADPSGDNLGAALVRTLRSRHPDLEVFGMAGPNMRAAGVHALARAEDAGGVGIVEVLGKVWSSLILLDRLTDAINTRSPDVVVTIDAPSLLLRLARRVRRPDRVNLHWVSPQLWAWRPGRVDTVAKSVDAVLCLLPFEPELYRGRVRAVFTGHPAAAIRPAPDAIAGGLALCPGSRPREIAALWPVMREVARQVRRARPSVRITVAVASSIDPRELTGLDCTFVSGISQVARCDAAVVASGTATLELAALGVPIVVLYRVHPLTAALARRLLTVRHVALPNLLAGLPLAPEHLQSLDPDAIASDVLRWWGRTDQFPREIITSLQGDSAISAAADEVDAFLTASQLH